ncbi:hypothetical protein ESZ50_07375 [Weissella muntiaci]|uniref:Uncharacterized protein n=1 Tax=Weissella muntiaci TaxID=2508881 RepID=A0A6C2C521_9LACO|nr:hypothetical protein [Weissella muntiaci]TYC49058.1 hypothetical protein ESZ50_07375 [Weissella muntiaci]
MEIKKFFGASFEQSRVIEGDQFLKWMINDVEQPNHEDKPVLIVLLGLGTLYGIYLLPAFAHYLVTGNNKKSLISLPEINLLPNWVAIGEIVIFILFWLLSRFLRRRYNNLFWRHMNVNLLVLFVMLEFNLISLMFFQKEWGIFGVLTIITLLLVTTIVSVKKQLGNLEIIIFETDGNSKITNKNVKYALFIIGLVIILLVLWKIFLSKNIDKFGGIIIIPLMFIILNVMTIMLEVLFEIPYILLNFYKHKYSEEYRIAEGKTPREWYGPKHLKKESLR